MAPNRGHTKPKTAQNRSLKRKREVEDIETLLHRVNDLDPKPATLPESFSELPLSHLTLTGLQASHFTKLTPIQAHGIPSSLKGNDVLGSAKTGSGKTLSFLVPVLENLYRKRWTEYDGVGALILSPTRELAIQIFDVLRKIGRNHTFSAGLVIGGKSLREERDRLGKMNILVATPGRMLQHMDQTADLDIGNLQMLVLDEADRIMDMGFQTTVDAIVEHLPRERQTLLFSATQTKKVSDLARLSLRDPEFISVEEEADNATPAQLSQNYVVTPLRQKLDTLWSFLRSNTKKKILVFLSSGKQVRFVYEAFRHLQPGVPLLHLHGRQKQSVRMDITTRFSNSQYACLFSTDVAARGLDFPAVDWVLQVDCPEDADTYIHRVGRTARYNSSGHAVLFLDPSEEPGMLDALKKKRINGLEEIHVKEKKMQSSIQNQLQNMCFKDPELKYLGQKAFASYVRSVFTQKDKSIFDVKKLDLEAFAACLGLPGAPRVKFIKGDDAKRLKNMPRALAAMDNEISDEDADDEEKEAKHQVMEDEEKKVRTKYDRMFERRNQDVLTDHYMKMIDEGDERSQDTMIGLDADEDDGFMTVKTRYDVGDKRLGTDAHDSSSKLDSGEVYTLQADNKNQNNDTNNRNERGPQDDPNRKKVVRLSSNPDVQPLIIDSKRREKLLKSKKALLKYKGHGTHIVFNSDDEDDNQGHAKVYYEGEEDFQKEGDATEQRERFLRLERQKAEDADAVDREVARQKRLEKKIKRKQRENEAAAASDDENGDAGDEVGVQLAPYTSDDDERDDPESDTGGNTSSQEGDAEKLLESREQQQKKRKRKWFEDPTFDNDNDHKAGGPTSGKPRPSKADKKTRPRRDVESTREPQTLEDLEALATGLLSTR